MHTVTYCAAMHVEPVMHNTVVPIQYVRGYASCMLCVFMLGYMRMAQLPVYDLMHPAVYHFYATLFMHGYTALCKTYLLKNYPAKFVKELPLIPYCTSIPTSYNLEIIYIIFEFVAAAGKALSPISLLYVRVPPS